VVGLWDHLGIATSHVVGISLGGKLALALASRQPRRVSSVVACACREPADATLAAAWQGRIDTVQAEGMAPIAEENVPRWFPEAFRRSEPDTVERVRRMMLNTRPEGFIACAAALQEQRPLPLGDIQGRALLVGGSEDAAITARLDAIRQRIPGAALEILEGAGHLLNVDQSSRFNALLAAHLGEAA